MLMNDEGYVSTESLYIQCILYEGKKKYSVNKLILKTYNIWFICQNSTKERH